MVLSPFLSAHSARAAGRRPAARTQIALIGKVVLGNGGPQSGEPCFLDDLSLTGAGLTIARNAPSIGNHAALFIEGIETCGSRTVRTVCAVPV